MNAYSRNSLIIQIEAIAKHSTVGKNDCSQIDQLEKDIILGYPYRFFSLLSFPILLHQFFTRR
jgi:hypothetical protein